MEGRERIITRCRDCGVKVAAQAGVVVTKGDISVSHHLHSGGDTSNLNPAIVRLALWEGEGSELLTHRTRLLYKVCLKENPTPCIRQRKMA
ncbi:hypothetical protein E2C01_101986 [Portunus trituberculatus]|uniref:Uncharacterized protein n=1 Tax=Portunus trituberculatus TaxID=210409 RepID=A0A5B7KC02_PORTR|nr:hypothetical protein [Portunus trituberculatus]